MLYEVITADDPVVLEHLGDVYRSLGLGGKARAAYGRALELAPASSGLREKFDALPPEK